MTDQSNRPQCTPIYEDHVKRGGRMVEFAGWMMPVEYEGLRVEHHHVRNQVGLFDVSHMGEIRIQGTDALAYLQKLTSNDLSAIGVGQAQYSLLMNENGGIVDDLIIYCLEKNADYLLCVNAANTLKDWNWLVAHIDIENRREHVDGQQGTKTQRDTKFQFQISTGTLTLTNESHSWGQIAVQGPDAVKLTAKILGLELEDVRPFHFRWVEFNGSQCIVARTGYTGEDGFEIFTPWDKTLNLWSAFFESVDFNPKPIGLGARDTLRTEMKYSLYGHEIDDTTDPLSAGLGWVVKADQKDFVGKSEVQKVKKDGLQQKLIGFKLIDKGIPRQGYRVLSVDKREIGRVTSGTLSPTLGEAIGIAYVSAEFATAGQEIAIDVRGRPAKAIVVPTPFVKRK